MIGGLQEVPWVKAPGRESDHHGRRRGPVGSGGGDPSPQSRVDALKSAGSGLHGEGGRRAGQRCVWETAGFQTRFPDRISLGHIFEEESF